MNPVTVWKRICGLIQAEYFEEAYEELDGLLDFLEGNDHVPDSLPPRQILEFLMSGIAARIESPN